MIKQRFFLITKNAEFRFFRIAKKFDVFVRVVIYHENIFAIKTSKKNKKQFVIINAYKVLIPWRSGGGCLTK